MFYLLCGALCLAVFSLLLSIGVVFNVAGYRFAFWIANRIDRTRLPNLIFLIHLAPFLLATGVVLGFVLPSFVRLEPHSTREALGPGLIAGALLGAATLVGIFMRSVQTIRATSRQEAEWLKNSEPLGLKDNDPPIFVVITPGVLMAVTGILRPKIFISQKIALALSCQELAAALSHEVAHVQSRDNLKQLLWRITRLPRWVAASRLFSAWINSSELVADRAAISNGTSAYELASALVKVARLGTATAPLPEVAASHLIPDHADSAIASRVLQLREIMNQPAKNRTSPAVMRNAIGMKWLAAAVAAALYMLSLNPLLPRVHEALEWLVR